MKRKTECTKELKRTSLVCEFKWMFQTLQFLTLHVKILEVLWLEELTGFANLSTNRKACGGISTERLKQMFMFLFPLKK